MDITIHSLSQDDIELLICQDTDEFGRIIRRPSRFDDTVDLLLNVKHFGVDEDRLLFVFPNEAQLVVPIPSHHYMKIEVM